MQKQAKTEKFFNLNKTPVFISENTVLKEEAITIAGERLGVFTPN